MLGLFFRFDLVILTPYRATDSLRRKQEIRGFTLSMPEHNIPSICAILHNQVDVFCENLAVLSQSLGIPSNASQILISIAM